MNKKTPIILAIIIFTLVLITACTSEDQAIEITEEDIEVVRNLTFEDVEGELTYVIENFVEDYSYLTMENLEFSQDELAVDPINQVKKFNNIEMRLELNVDSELADIDIEDELTMEDNFSMFVSDIERELLDTLMTESTYEFSRVISTDISFRDNENNLQHNSVAGHIRDPEIITTLRNEESEAERLSLEKIFNLIGEDKEVYQLSRFGIMDNGFIIELYYYPTDEEPKLTIEELRDEIYILVTEDQDFSEYINNRAEELVITINEESFYYDLDN